MKSTINLLIMFLVTLSITMAQSSHKYKIVDTGQNEFFSSTGYISQPSAGQDYYGQDANFSGYQPSYTDNGDGTVTDNVTGLMWQKNAVTTKVSYDYAVSAADTFSLAGYDDWRLPTIKEMFSLIMFYGETGMSADNSVPYINTDYFLFYYGDEDNGERFIDAQYVTSTEYAGLTMNGDFTVFGVNFADGRIKGYPTTMGNSDKLFDVKYVRGNTDYGKNLFTDNNDLTITDEATGLMWSKDDSKEGLNWKEALEWVDQKNAENYLGFNDWRLPNVKEMQSIVDYTRSPQTTNSASIDPIFNISEITDEGDKTNYPFFWSGTTHKDGLDYGSYASYVCFGEALGFMTDPMGNNATLMDVHGSGAQRSDPKEGDPDDYPTGHGPQGDVIRIYNYVRLVRDADSATTSLGDNSTSLPVDYSLDQNYPNPFNPSTKISFSIPEAETVNLTVYNAIGQKVQELINYEMSAGSHEVIWNAESSASGMYFYSLSAGNYKATRKMILMK